MSKRQHPLWMPLYVTKFLADTTNLSVAQVGAYINLLCAMWRSADGTLPNDDEELARASRVYPPQWKRVWKSIKDLFDIDGDRVTSTDLQAELGKANAKIVMKRAAASLGGQTTQFRRYGQTIRNIMTAHTPLKTNNGLQASAQASANHNRNIKEEEERSGPPRPETGGPSLEEGLQERASVFPLTKPTPPENPISDEERQVNLAKLHDLRRQLKGGAK